MTPGSRAWLLAICLSRVGAYMIYIAYAAALPVLQREWHMSATAAGGIASCFQLAYAISLMGCSEIADRVGAQRVFLIGTLATAIMAALFAAFARDYWSGLVLYTLLALALGGTYTTGVLLVAENVPVALVASGPIVGRALAWWVVRDTPNVVTSRAGGERFAGAVLRNRPAMLVIAGYTFHSWELLGMWAWTPAFLAACFVATGSAPDRGAGLGAYVASLFHVTGMLASMLAGVLADRLGRIPVMLMMASLSTVCSLVFGWLLGTPVAVVVALGLVYGFAALGDSPIYSTAITEVVTPAFRGAALALRSLAGYGAGAIAPLLFGAILDWYGGHSAEAWGWAFVSLGVAGLVAVASVLMLSRAPGAHVLRRARVES